MDLFWSGFLLSLSLCLDLGLVNVAAMRVGVQHGARASFALGAGSCVGDLVYAALAVAGIATLLDLPGVRWAVWIGGSLVLVWLCVKAVRDAIRHDVPGAREIRTVERRGLVEFFTYGVGLALASPSAILWFATVGGAVIAASADRGRASTWRFFAGFFLAGLLWSVVVAITSAQGRRFGARFVRAFAIASAVIFAVLAIKVFVDGLP